MASELEKAALRVIEAWDEVSFWDRSGVEEMSAAVDSLQVALRLTQSPPKHCPIHFLSNWIDGVCRTCAAEKPGSRRGANP